MRCMCEGGPTMVGHPDLAEAIGPSCAHLCWPDFAYGDRSSWPGFVIGGGRGGFEGFVCSILITSYFTC